MDENLIKSALEKSKVIVLDPNIGLPEHLQTTALAEVFKILISDGRVLEAPIKRVSSQETTIESTDFYKNLSEKLKVSKNELESIYDYSDGGVNLIIHPVPGATKTEQEQNAARLVLFGYKIGLKQEVISATLLREVLQNLGLGGTNFSTNVRAIKQDVVSLKKGNVNGYKLTFPGEQKVLELLKGKIPA